MFSLQIIDTDAFLDMPLSTQALYFHLSMRADDDGFIDSPKKIMKIIGAQEDDLKVLLTKRFILLFESGIIVIKHWRINNYIQKDRYQETAYLDEKKLILTKKNNSYTECVQSGNTDKVRLGKVREDKVILQSNDCSKNPLIIKEFSFKDKLEKMKKDKNLLIVIIAAYWEYSKLISPENEEQYQVKLKRELRAAQPLKPYTLNRIKEVMYWLNGEEFLTDIWTLSTVSKYIDKDLTIK